MKKVYQKPKISYESFQMSTSIASNCEVKLGSDELYLEGLGHAFAGKDGCSYEIELNDGDYNYNDSICYHVPTTGINIFAS